MSSGYKRNVGSTPSGSNTSSSLHSDYQVGDSGQSGNEIYGKKGRKLQNRNEMPKSKHQSAAPPFLNFNSSVDFPPLGENLDSSSTDGLVREMKSAIDLGREENTQNSIPNKLKDSPVSNSASLGAHLSASTTHQNKGMGLAQFSAPPSNPSNTSGVSGIECSQVDASLSIPSTLSRSKGMRSAQVDASLSNPSTTIEVKGMRRGQVDASLSIPSTPSRGKEMGPATVNSTLPDQRFLNHNSGARKWSSSQHSQNDRTFDICLTKRRYFIIEEESEYGQFVDWKREGILRPGMILLKHFLTIREQIRIVRTCQELGKGPGGFYQPGYNDGAKLRLHMMCLGLEWDPQTRQYSKTRKVDGCEPPAIPSEFEQLVQKSISEAHALIGMDSNVKSVVDVLPALRPDICIVNFYNASGRLGLHQDRDERKYSLKKGLPVVSFSVGDSAEFLYGDTRDECKAESILLESGDVLIFGGESRHIFHGVSSIIPKSAPLALLENTKLRPGRLNLTFRQY